MANWHELVLQQGKTMPWPYPIRYDSEQEIETDVLVIGGGIAGCWAAISAARKGVRVALVEKGDTIRSGAGGPGCDHWCNAPANPLSNVDPDEWAEHMAEPPYSNGIGIQIQCREDWDTLLEMEQMGGKIRDTDDEYVGAQGRDEKTKLMISPRYTKVHSYVPGVQKPVSFKSNPESKLNNVVIRVWGSTFKPALKKECKRLGVNILDRVMITSLLTENGIQGARVVGAVGFNNRTGEFMVFKSKAAVLATAGDWSLFLLNTELAGYNTFRSRTATGDGAAMAWRAGAALTMMERTGVLNLGTGFKHTWYGGAGDASYENVPLVDANGKRLPWPTQGWEDYGAMRPSPEVMEKITRGIQSGEYALPFWGDFPSMPEVERRVTWNLMLGEESTTRNIINSYGRAGFDPARHLLMNYNFIEGQSLPQWRTANGGGPVIDWNLKSTLDGLYVAGEQLFSPGDHSFAAATGRYAGRKAADYAREVESGKVSPEQIAQEKNRIYRPIKRTNGIDWKELHAGIARAMQFFGTQYKDERLLKMGLDALKEIEEVHVPRLFATDPHKLMRCIEDLSLLTHGQIILHASLARCASSQMLNFFRIDYPQVDPPEWNKFITVKLENGKVIVGELPLRYWGDMKANYEAHNRDYTGVYKGK
ncbi:MAG: FAD-dependent oxidoreductase [Dehalococcoidales bacterium]|jgi:succinate dehydrogenase/fumarate reductase flavoprotein subunit|nr:FAD-dependent oxidoreductase [Dehalococcoidales bacterium]